MKASLLLSALSQRKEEEGEELTSMKNFSSAGAAFLSLNLWLLFTKNSQISSVIISEAQMVLPPQNITMEQDKSTQRIYNCKLKASDREARDEFQNN